MAIRHNLDYPLADARVKITFEEALSVVCTFAESDLSGDSFSYREVEQLEAAASLLRGKLNKSEAERAVKISKLRTAGREPHGN